ncbi:sister chromatid cohesion 1 protein 1 [Tanacetum coccineum]
MSKVVGCSSSIDPKTTLLATAHKAYVDKDKWSEMSMPSTAGSGRFSSAKLLMVFENHYSGVASGSSVPSIHKPRGNGVKNTASSGSEHGFVSHGSDLNSVRSNKKRLFSSSRRSRSSLPPMEDKFPWDHPDLNYKLTEVNENDLPENDLMVETRPTQTKNSHHLISHWTGSTQESLNQLALGLDRKRLAFLFYQTCVLAYRDFLKVEQKKPYGIILIPRGSFIVAACENMIGGTRTRPGDKVTASNGKTIEAATIVDDNSDVVLFGEETEAEKKAAE